MELSSKLTIVNMDALLKTTTNDSDYSAHADFLLDCLGKSKLSNAAPVAVSIAPGLYWISLGWQHQAHSSLQVSTNIVLFYY